MAILFYFGFKLKLLTNELRKILSDLLKLILVYVYSKSIFAW